MDEINANDKVTIYHGASLKEIIGQGKVEAVRYTLRGAVAGGGEPLASGWPCERIDEELADDGFWVGDDQEWLLGCSSDGNSNWGGSKSSHRILLK
mgnify:CR=1 FL=1